MPVKDKLRTVSSYKTTDGSLFDAIDDAIEHQEWLDFNEWYLQNNQLADVTSSTIYIWIRNNDGTITHFLETGEI